MPTLDRNKVAADWATPGFTCDLWTDPPPPGQITGTVHHPQIGQELLIPAGAVHSARNIGETAARWLYGYQRA